MKKILLIVITFITAISSCSKHNPDAYRNPFDTTSVFSYQVDGVDYLILGSSNTRNANEGSTISYVSVPDLYLFQALKNLGYDGVFEVYVTPSELKSMKPINVDQKNGHVGRVSWGPNQKYTARLGSMDSNPDFTLTVTRFSGGTADGTFSGTAEMAGRRVPIKDGKFRNVKIIN